MTRHLSEATLRRLVDEPVGVSDTDRDHAATCSGCLASLADVRRDAMLIGSTLGRPPVLGRDEVEAGWQRLSATVSAPARPEVAASPVSRDRSRRWTALLRRPAVAGVGVAALLAGGGVAAASDWLPIFNTEQVQAVSLSEADLIQLPDLSAYGETEIIDEPEIRVVADADAAQEATGLSVPRVAALPTGVTGEPTYQVGDEATAVFTFSEDMARQAAAEAGETLPAPPDGLDGNKFRLTAGPGVAQVWSEARGIPAMVVGTAVAPTGFSSGVPFDTARDYLLSLPGIPADVADQLRTFSADGSTLPLPVPAEYVETSSTEVNGSPATVLNSRDGLFSGVVWVNDGVVTAVLGSLDEGEVLDVARELR